MVVLYTTHCPQCQVLQKKLEQKNIDFEVVDDIEVMNTKGMLSAPQLEVDGELLTFAQAITWVNKR